MKQIEINELVFLLAIACAGLMGFAIQRGATCMVAAVEEIIESRRTTRILALAEAALWVSGGLLLARLVGELPLIPPSYSISRWTVAGGVLLGLGAYVNRACLFGTIARIGSGEWAFVMTPLGFFLGCLMIRPLFGHIMPEETLDLPPLLAFGTAAAIPVLALILWRGLAILRAARRQELVAHAWSPHQATAIIAIIYVVMILSVGTLSYSEALSSLAQGMSSSLPAKLLLFAALLFGSIIGGWRSVVSRPVFPSLAAILRCTTGGFLMALGGLMIPGGNDTLVLIGTPLARPFAWVALACMILSIAAASLIERRINAT